MALNVWSRLSELRSRWSGPVTSRSPELGRILGLDGGSSTGVPVNEWTALNYSAFWAAVSIIASDVASLPLILYKRESKGGKSKYTEPKLYRLLHDEPNPEMSSVVFRETVQAHALTLGNGYAEIERDGGAKPTALWPLLPDRVEVFRDQAGHLRYRVRRDDGSFDVFLPADILHIPGLGFDGLVGYSVIAKAQESIGLGLATERFGATFFGNGSTFGGILEHPGKMGELAQKNFREALAARHQGVDRAHKFLVLEEGMKYQKLGIPPNEAQFLESRKFQIEEIARWFRLPPHKIGSMEHATFSNIEHQTLDYVRSCLRSWLVRWEQEINRKLISPLERNIQFVEHSLEGLLRGDSMARAEFYRSMVNMGVYSPNMVLEKENENSIGKAGDVHMVQGAMVPLDRLNDIVNAQVKPKPSPAAPQPDPAAARALEEAIKAHDAATQRAEGYLRQTMNAETALETEKGDKTALMVQRDEALRQFQVSQSEVDALHAQIVAIEERIEREKRELDEAHAKDLDSTQHKADEAIAIAIEEGRKANEARDALLLDVAAKADAIAAVHAQMAARERELDAIRAEKAALAEERQSAVSDLEAKAEALRQDVAVKEADLAQKEAELAATATRMTETEATLAAVLAEKDHRHAESEARSAEWAQQMAALQADVEAQAQAAEVARAQIVAAHDEALRAAYDAQQAALLEREDALALAQERQDRIAEAEARAAEIAAQIASLQVETESRCGEAARASAELQVVTVLAERAAADLATAQAELDTVAILAAERQARTVALERQITELQAETTRKEQDAADALAQIAVVEQRAAEQVEARADAFIREQRTKEADRLTAMLTAHRALVVDAVNRVVRRESERARSKQATPQKLRSWAETFYLTHDATVIEALLPAVRAHLAFMQSDDDPELVASQYARAYVDESKRQIMAVVDSAPDDLNQTLERVLSHWESKRADMLADRLMREGIQYVRSFR